MTILTTTDELAAFCRSLAGTEYVTVDTEFMRDRTYWPKLCLVQLGGPNGAVAVDPLAAGIDLAPLFAVMDDPSILKVFHAARQDVEIFYHLTGRIPAPLFDTQVAAMVCGFGEQVSYEALASRLADARLDKASRFTDWAQRPLTERQVIYALSDVTHLRVVYEYMRRHLDQTGRESWLVEELAVLTQPATYQNNPRESWQRLKVRGGDGKFRAVLQELAAWREEEAQRVDIPRGRVLRDESLLEIAHHAPDSVEALSRTRGVSAGFAEGKHGTALLDAVRRALARPSADWPPALEGSARHGVSERAAATVELLRVLLRMVSEEEGVASRLVASAHDLDMIAMDGEKAQTPVLHGWRHQIFGEQALALRRGDLALAIEGGRVKTLATRP
ncbi:MAG: ribonuclease D [Alphaproteobacteria bacterium]|nr:MAG: ribonuclease D [Alphaproteobacteria bacterium]